jgi:hypothetical protein
MSAARPGDGAGVDTSGVLDGLLDGLTDPAVRDLAWLLFSEDLLCGQLPQAPVAEPWADRAEAQAASLWLAQLDRDPTPLREALAANPSTRLGRYAEILLGWFLEHGPAPRLVAANVPLRRAGHTLGECDFLVRTPDGRRLHWELAVKCYLHTGQVPATLADFVGPNLRDRFDRKFARLVDHQLRLSEREEFVSLGYPGPWLAQMFVKGWLFYRAGALAQADAIDPSSIAPGHARGWWVTRSEWSAFAARQAVDGWSVLPRLAWLAPRRIATGENGAAHSGAFFERMRVAAPVDPETLLATLPHPDDPVMIAALTADSANGYAERSRGFIVPDDWPARAQVFACE